MAIIDNQDAFDRLAAAVNNMLLRAHTQRAITISVANGMELQWQQRPSGVTVQWRTNRPLGGHRLVAANGMGEIDYADCDTLAAATGLIGMTTAAVATGGVAQIVRQGLIDEPSWSWTPQQPVYLGTNGVPVQTLPPGAACQLVVGVAITSTCLFMAPRDPIRLI